MQAPTSLPMCRMAMETGQIRMLESGPGWPLAPARSSVRAATPFRNVSEEPAGTPIR